MPRGSGILPNNDQDRKKELQKIDEYKNLVDTVKSEVSNDSLFEVTLAKASRFIRKITQTQLSS